jgi:hypothetical protein
MKFVSRTALTGIIALFAVSLNSAAYAGPYTDDLTKCIIESTTQADRIEFVK